jgi:hypothetical protein
MPDLRPPTRQNSNTAQKNAMAGTHPAIAK